MDVTSSADPSYSNDSTDTELIQGLQAQQVNALDRLYDRYGRLVFGVALRILKNVEEAEDLTQEIFLKVWQNSDAYQTNRGSFSSYLVVMTRSRAIDRIRSRQSQHRVAQVWQAETELQSSCLLEDLSVQERATLIRSALDDLNDEERQVLEIAYYEGFSQSQIAKHTQLPLGTVKSRSRQALKKLRHALRPIL